MNGDAASAQKGTVDAWRFLLSVLSDLVYELDSVCFEQFYCLGPLMERLDIVLSELMF